MCANESTRIDANRRRAPSRRRARRALDRSPRATAARRRAIRASSIRARVAPSQNAVARCGLLLLFLRLRIRCIRRIMRTQSTITTWITRVIVDVTLCVHTRMSEFLLLVFLRLRIRCTQRIMRTRSTITTWITRVIVDVTLCVHTRMSEFSTDDASRRIHRSVGTGRRARQSRCERCGAFERDSRRFATRAIPRGVHGNADRRATTARRSR